MKSVEYIRGFRKDSVVSKEICRDLITTFDYLLRIVWPMVLSHVDVILDWDKVDNDAKSCFSEMKDNNFFLGVMADESTYPQKIVSKYGPIFLAEAFGDGGNYHQAEELLEKAFEGVADWKWERFTAAIESKKRGEDMTQSLIWVILIATIIVAFLIVGAKITQPSLEFNEIKNAAKKATWAMKLLKDGPSLLGLRVWSVENAWPEAITNMDDNEIIAAITFLDNMHDFRAINPQRGDKYDKLSMIAVPPLAQWVFSLERPGLKRGNCVIEHAKVRCASADYLSLIKNKRSVLTNKYLKNAKQDLTKDYALRLKGDALAGVQDTANRDDFNVWLSSIVEATPGNELLLFQPVVGDTYDNREMYCFTEKKIVTREKARVTKVLSNGLKRANGTLIRLALVEASDSQRIESRKNS